jgi:hypothetical protein
MELNEESGAGAKSAGGETPEAQAGAGGAQEDLSRGESEAEVEVDADVAEYKSEVESEVAASEVESEEEEAVEEKYPPHYVPTGPLDEKQSLFRRLSPYLTVAGLLLIARIVVYSLRRRRR